MDKRRRNEGSGMELGGEKYEAGLKKRGDALSAFLLAAKLRIDVSRSIQRLAAPSRTARRGLPLFVEKKKREKRKSSTPLRARE